MISSVKGEREDEARNWVRSQPGKREYYQTVAREESGLKLPGLVLVEEKHRPTPVTAP